MIRSVTIEDSKAVCDLADQLGYQVHISDVEQNIQKSIDDLNSHLRVAVDSDGNVIAWAQTSRTSSVLLGAKFEIASIVVDAKVRGKGIGKALVHDAEEWCKQHGAIELRLSSRITRNDAHSFYLSLGYEVINSSLFFKKCL